MAESKSIKMLTLIDLAVMARDIIVGSIERSEFTVIEVSRHKFINLTIQGMIVKLFYSGAKVAFEEYQGLDDLTEGNPLRCFIQIESGSKAFEVLMKVLVDSRRDVAIEQLRQARMQVLELGLELGLELA